MSKDGEGVEVNKLRGTAMLLVTAILWGSSFPAIKVTVSMVDEMTYTWIRGAIALLALAPLVSYYHVKNRVRGFEIIGGLITGVVYSLGLWLQGWGTRFTTASSSAFITGLNVIFVHIYDAAMGRGYPLSALISLILSISGLYLLTEPKGGIGIGEILVLVSAVFWAMQIILVNRFNRSNPVTFTFYEILPSLIFAPASIAAGLFNPQAASKIIPSLLYLGLACTVLAFMSQVYGQRWLRPHEAALILLLEPVFAAIFSALTLGEKFTTTWILGAILILTAIIITIQFGKRSR